MAYNLNNPTRQLPLTYQQGSIGGAFRPSMVAPSPTAARPGGMAGVNSFIASPTGAALINAAGSYMSARGQEQQFNQDRALRQQQIGNDARLTIANQLQERSLVGATRPMGESQNFANRQLLAAAIANSLFSGNGAIRPNNAAVSGGMGFRPMPIDPRLAGALGNPQQVMQSTAQSIAQREADLLQANPNLTPTNLGGMGLPNMPGGFDPRSVATQRGMDLFGKQDQLYDQSLQAQGKLDLSKQTGKEIDPKTGLPKGYELDPKTGELKKKSFWQSKTGKAIKIGALGAATIATAGAASPALAAAIAAGSGAFQGATSGGGWKGALMGAGLGAATAGLGGGAGAAASKGAGALGKQAMVQAAKQMAKDPMFYAEAYGMARQ